jgi:hypothetical protein
MAFLSQDDMRKRAKGRSASEGIPVEDILKRVSRDYSDSYDIFLSQTIRDAELVLGVYDQLTAIGLRVFCDWLDAPDLDRSAVTPANAHYVRQVMQKSTSLLFLDTAG